MEFLLSYTVRRTLNPPLRG